VTLTEDNGVAHTHTVMAHATAATQTSASGNMLAIPSLPPYAPTGPNTRMNSGVVSTAGGQPHANLQPTLVLAYCIAIQGIYPSPG
jgi:microcystin-dependent protein